MNKLFSPERKEAHNMAQGFAQNFICLRRFRLASEAFPKLGFNHAVCRLGV